jgi:hypothetical protein
MKFTKAETEIVNQISRAGELVVDAKNEPKFMAKVEKLVNKNPDAFYFEVRKSGLVYVSFA